MDRTRLTQGNDGRTGPRLVWGLWEGSVIHGNNTTTRSNNISRKALWCATPQQSMGNAALAQRQNRTPARALFDGLWSRRKVFWADNRIRRQPASSVCVLRQGNPVGEGYCGLGGETHIKRARYTAIDSFFLLWGRGFFWS